MKTYRIAALILAALPLGAQTAAELLQKGIYDQETAGDLDGAISIYHQIVNSGSSPRDVAAQAQYRLAQTLLQKGDLPNGAQEFSNLARNYADYGKLVSSLATQARGNTFYFPSGAR
jgi:TolA-binding protein